MTWHRYQSPDKLLVLLVPLLASLVLCILHILDLFELLHVTMIARREYCQTHFATIQQIAGCNDNQTAYQHSFQQVFYQLQG